MEKIRYHMVIEDSTTWLDYFEKDKTKHAFILETLIKEDKIVICGYTLAEILKDIKDKETFEKPLKCFLALSYVEIEKEDWIKASRFVFRNKKLTLEKALLKVLSQKWNLEVLQGAKND